MSCLLLRAPGGGRRKERKKIKPRCFAAGAVRLPAAPPALPAAPHALPACSQPNHSANINLLPPPQQPVHSLLPPLRRHPFSSRSPLYSSKFFQPSVTTFHPPFLLHPQPSHLLLSHRRKGSCHGCQCPGISPERGAPAPAALLAGPLRLGAARARCSWAHGRVHAHV